MASRGVALGRVRPKYPSLMSHVHGFIPIPMGSHVEAVKQASNQVTHILNDDGAASLGIYSRQNPFNYRSKILK